jgi:colicin import membrane protein
MNWRKRRLIDVSDYRFAVGVALFLHGLLFIVYFVISPHLKPRAMPALAAPAIIQAMVVSSAQLNQTKPALPPLPKIENRPKLVNVQPQTETVPVPNSPITWPEKKVPPLLVKKTDLPSPVKKIPPKTVIKKVLKPKSESPQRIVHKDSHSQSKPIIKKVTPPKPIPPASLKAVQQNVQQLLQQEISHLAQQQQKIAQQNAALTEKYRQLILQSIAQRWIVPPDLDPHLETKLQIQLAPGGMVLAVTIVKSSGNPILDRSAQAAVYKASPLPVPKNNALFTTFQYINLTVRPEGMLTPS